MSENNVAGISYEDIYTRLNNGAVIVGFMKKNGDVRIMLCTRDLGIASSYMQHSGMALQSHDNKCNRSNGNIAVIDLEIKEPRSFNISRLICAQDVEMRFFGQYEQAIEQVYKIREAYSSGVEQAIEDANLKGDIIDDMFKSSSLT